MSRSRKPTDVARSCDLLLLTVPDDMLENVVTTMVGAGRDPPGPGRLPHLRPARPRRAPVGRGDRCPARVAMHPAMTFTGTAVDLDRLPGCVFGVTGPRRTRALAEALVADLGGIAMWVPEEQAARCTTPVSRTARTTWSPWSPRRWSCSPRPARRTLRPRSRPLLGAALDNALTLGRRRADRPDRARRRQHRARAPRRHRRDRPGHASPSTSRWRRPPPTGRSSTAGCCRSAPVKIVGAARRRARPGRASAHRPAP